MQDKKQSETLMLTHVADLVLLRLSRNGQGGYTVSCTPLVEVANVLCMDLIKSFGTYKDAFGCYLKYATTPMFGEARWTREEWLTMEGMATGNSREELLRWAANEEVEFLGEEELATES